MHFPVTDSSRLDSSDPLYNSDRGSNIAVSTELEKPIKGKSQQGIHNSSVYCTGRFRYCKLTAQKIFFLFGVEPDWPFWTLYYWLDYQMSALGLLHALTLCCPGEHIYQTGTMEVSQTEMYRAWWSAKGQGYCWVLVNFLKGHLFKQSC